MEGFFARHTVRTTRTCFKRVAKRHRTLVLLPGQQRIWVPKEKVLHPVCSALTAQRGRHIEDLGVPRLRERPSGHAVQEMPLGK